MSQTFEQSFSTTTTEQVEVSHGEMAYFNVDAYLAEGTSTEESELTAKQKQRFLAEIQELKTKLSSTERKLETAEQRAVAAEEELDSSKKKLGAKITHATRGLRTVAERYNQVIAACQRLGVTKTTTMEQLIKILTTGPSGDPGEIERLKQELENVKRELESVKRERDRLLREIEIDRVAKPPPYDPAPLVKENTQLSLKYGHMTSKHTTLATLVASAKKDSESESAELRKRLKEANDELEEVKKHFNDVRAALDGGRVASDLAINGIVSVSTKLAMQAEHKCRYTVMDFDATVEISAEGGYTHMEFVHEAHGSRTPDSL